MKAAATAFKTADARGKLITSLNNMTGQSNTPATTGAAASAARVATAQENAVNSLDELKNAFGNKDTAQQLEKAHELKIMLDQQAKELDKAGGSEPRLGASARADRANREERAGRLCNN